jgi:hypothetical protein
LNGFFSAQKHTRRQTKLLSLIGGQVLSGSEAREANNMRPTDGKNWQQIRQLKVTNAAFLYYNWRLFVCLKKETILGTLKQLYTYSYGKN